MSWLETTFWWYLTLLVLGSIFFPITKKLFGRFFYDSGYPFSKTIAILAISYSAFVLGVVKILSFNLNSLLLIIAVFILLNYLLIRQKLKRISIDDLLQDPKTFFLIFEEILFFAALVFWVYVRGQEPSIRGLEKFMDFGFINSILKGRYFPPVDMWLSGQSINYYYFGHLTGALLTKLSRIPSNLSYNLILATIFAQSITQVFSIGFNLIYNLSKKSFKLAFFTGLLSSFLFNLGGNLHTIYTFTTGYPNDKPIPFWKILSKYNPDFYWYPNATRFIPFTIHEFPIYSYVVADLHGHVFDIPFVLLTLAVLFTLFLNPSNKKGDVNKIPNSILLGFLTAIHYMTNAFDGPIYILLTIIIFFYLFRLSRKFMINTVILILSFVFFTLPFSVGFKPFVTGIGVNCGYGVVQTFGLVKNELFYKLGPFIFEKGNCQVSPIWMLPVLWGFFWFNFIFFVLWFKNRNLKKESANSPILRFLLILFSFSTCLIILPEFFYIKDIYPAHFRANTMFKMGYQAFMMMSIAASATLAIYKLHHEAKLKHYLYYIGVSIVIFLVSIYPSFAIASYYGRAFKTPQLDGSLWIGGVYEEYSEIIEYLNKVAPNQLNILEAQGDSYTDFNVVSSYTGLPTPAGWWVHEWLWRGTSEAVGQIAPLVQDVYETKDISTVSEFVKKYKVKYIIVGSNERSKYKNINEDKFNKIGRLVYTSKNSLGKIFLVLDR